MLAAEIELANLRKRFVATSKEIAKDLSLMVGRIDEEPPEVRALQRAAAKEIATAQERVWLEAEQLAGPPEQCLALMRAVCEAQQAAQLQLTVIIKRHRPSTLLRANLDERLANIARQLEVSAAASRLVDGNREQLPTTIRATGERSSSAGSIAIEPQSGNGDRRSDLSSTHDDTSEAMLSPSMRLAVMIKAGTSLAFLLVVACAGLVLFFFSASLPGVGPHRKVAAEKAIREHRGPGVTPMPRPESEETGTAAQLAAAGNTKRPPQMASAASSSPTNASTPKRASTMSIANPNPDAPALPRIDPLPSQPAAVPAMPASPILPNDAERFVPVVFTHKDKGTALRTFAELQRRYPKLMARRQSELQLVDTGKNGIWYRLVVLPAGPHQEASETCGRLEAAGYNRCWVKPY